MARAGRKAIVVFAVAADFRFEKRSLYYGAKSGDRHLESVSSQKAWQETRRLCRSKDGGAASGRGGVVISAWDDGNQTSGRDGNSSSIFER